MLLVPLEGKLPATARTDALQQRGTGHRVLTVQARRSHMNKAVISHLSNKTTFDGQRDLVFRPIQPTSPTPSAQHTWFYMCTSRRVPLGNAQRHSAEEHVPVSRASLPNVNSLTVSPNMVSISTMPSEKVSTSRSFSVQPIATIIPRRTRSGHCIIHCHAISDGRQSFTFPSYSKL